MILEEPDKDRESNNYIITKFHTVCVDIHVYMCGVPYSRSNCQHDRIEEF